MTETTPSAVGERFDLARRIADAVLYEGYVLYPYGASSGKNRVRWQFGVVGPRRRDGSTGESPSSMRTQCLVAADSGGLLWVRVRFLRVSSRTVEKLGPDGYEPVESMEVDGEIVTRWEEGTEGVLDTGPLVLAELVGGSPDVRRFVLAAEREQREISDSEGRVSGRVTRTTRELEGRVDVRAERCAEADGLVRVTVTVDNLTTMPAPPPATRPAPGASARNQAAEFSLVGLHVLLAAQDATFVSLMDPPEHARQAARACENSGWYPVLTDEEDRLVLSSPIILYDHPAVAPESPGDMFDATEIDEILALRVLTLTDEEKREARGTDARARAVIDRCDDMPPEVFARLHGAIRSLRPVEQSAEFLADSPQGDVPGGQGGAPWWDPGVDASVDPERDTVVVGGEQIGRGARVRLRPGPGGDAQDLFLEGMTATVAAVFSDVDGGVQVAVVVEDDPASELHEWYGRYRYFRPDELELVEVRP